MTRVVSEGRAETTQLGHMWGICGYPSSREEGVSRRYNTLCTEGQAVQLVTGQGMEL